MRLVDSLLIFFCNLSFAGNLSTLIGSGGGGVGGSNFARRDVITASGTWTVPAGVTQIMVDVWGGGGGGNLCAGCQSALGGNGASAYGMTAAPGTYNVTGDGGGGGGAGVGSGGNGGAGKAFGSPLRALAPMVALPLVAAEAGPGKMVLQQELQELEVTVATANALFIGINRNI